MCKARNQIKERGPKKKKKVTAKRLNFFEKQKMGAFGIGTEQKVTESFTVVQNMQAENNFECNGQFLQQTIELDCGRDKSLMRLWFWLGELKILLQTKQVKTNLIQMDEPHTMNS